MTQNLPPQTLVLILGLSFFLGLAYEDFYARRGLRRPGGVRTFPLLALLGTVLYVVDPVHVLAFTAGLLVLGSWLYAWYRRRTRPVRSQAESESREAGATGAEPLGGSGLVGPVCNLLAYVIGPIALLQPSWVPVSLTVSAVLLMGARDPLHALARHISFDEIATFGKFLILAGIVLPLLPDEPVTTLTTLTPHQVWTAVVVISALSYASYLAQRYVSPTGGILVAAVLGGLYSSTATTVVLARQLRDDPEASSDIRAGIVLATALMYLRVEIVIAVFNLALARAFAPWLLGLFALGVGLAAACYWLARGRQSATTTAAPPTNPLELRTAFVFALTFVVVSVSATWVKTRFGHAGVYWLAAVVGITDIDPFVLSLAQGSVQNMMITAMMAAILIAAASNNVLKAAYAIAFAGLRASLAPLVALGVLAAVSLAAVVWLA